MKADFEYDDDEDILYIYNPEYKKDVLFSIDIDDSILDVGRKGEIVGIEIMDASIKFARDENEQETIKEALKNIKESFLKATYGVNSFIVKFGFFALIQKQPLRERMLIQVPIRKELMVKT